MANYLKKYQGQYRLKLEIDESTNDFPRNEDGSIEDIDMYMLNPKSPCIIRDEEDSFIYLILPVNFTTVR